MKHHDKTVWQQIQTIWSADFEKGTTVLEMPFSREDHLMYKLLQNSVKLVNGRFQLPLSWRSGVTSLPNNQSVALNRLNDLWPETLYQKSVFKGRICQHHWEPK